MKTYQQIATVTLGIFAGGMLLIALALVPYWTSMDPASYRTSFQSIGPHLGKYMIPLMILSILFPALCAHLDKNNFYQWSAAGILILLIVPLYGGIHGPINDLILGSTVFPDTELASLRNKWIFWHWVRTLLGLTAFGLAAKR